MVDDIMRQQVAESYRATHPSDRPLPGHQELISLAVHIAGVAGAAINLVVDAEQRVVASSVLEAGSAYPLQDSLCARVVSQTLGSTQVPDLTRDDRFADSRFVTGEIAELRFYAAFPLRTPVGVEVGTLCVFDERMHRLDDATMDALEMLARRVVDLYELSVRGRQLSIATEVLTTQAGDLERTNRALDAFTGQVGHDLKGPVSSLRMSLDMLCETTAVVGDHEASWLADSAATSARRMSQMIDDCLDFARQGGRLRVCDVDLSGLLDEVLDDLTAELGGIRVRRGTLPTVVGDPAQLGHLLQNLISNAAKFVAGVPVPSIRISADVRQDGFCLQVADNGPGVAVADRSKVFQLRWQGDHGKPGLGLATCQRIVDAHGGTIRVEDAPEGGALFVVDVPALQQRTTAPVDASVSA